MNGLRPPEPINFLRCSDCPPNIIPFPPAQMMDHICGVHLNYYPLKCLYCETGFTVHEAIIWHIKTEHPGYDFEFECLRQSDKEQQLHEKFNNCQNSLLQPTPIMNHHQQSMMIVRPPNGMVPPRLPPNMNPVREPSLVPVSPYQHQPLPTPEQGSRNEGSALRPSPSSGSGSPPPSVNGDRLRSVPPEPTSHHQQQDTSENYRTRISASSAAPPETPRNTGRKETKRPRGRPPKARKTEIPLITISDSDDPDEDDARVSAEKKIDQRDREDSSLDCVNDIIEPENPVMSADETDAEQSPIKDSPKKCDEKAYTTEETNIDLSSAPSKGDEELETPFVVRQSKSPKPQKSNWALRQLKLRRATRYQFNCKKCGKDVRERVQGGSFRGHVTLFHLENDYVYECTNCDFGRNFKVVQKSQIETHVKIGYCKTPQQKNLKISFTDRKEQLKPKIDSLITDCFQISPKLRKLPPKREQMLTKTLKRKYNKLSKIPKFGDSPEPAKKKKKKPKVIMLTCQICNMKVVETEESVADHLYEEHLPPTTVCPYCDFGSKVDGETSQHVRSVHPDKRAKTKNIAWQPHIRDQYKDFLPKCFPNLTL